jgi:hypothetical protein
MSQPLNIIIVERLGGLKSLAIKDFKMEELYKKCGFKKSDDFIKQVEWNAKYDGKKYFIEVYAKTEGRANSENKYDFPPPIDETLFYGNCAILAYLKEKENNQKVYTDISLPLWNKIYEKLFGGFEDLAATAAEDEEEEDELANVPKEKKTKQGYLKDGFVVDSSDTEDTNSNDLNEEEDDDDDDEDEDTDDQDDDIIIEDLGSELSEESYDYDSETESVTENNDK